MPNSYSAKAVLLSAVEILSYEFQHFFLVAVYLTTQGLVVVRTELLDDAVDHSRAEHLMFFKDCSGREDIETD